MDIATMVDTVCQKLAAPSSYLDALGSPGLPGIGSTHLSRMYLKRQRDEEFQDSVPLAYRHAVDGYLQRYNTLMATPIPWNGNADENQWHANNRDREIRSLRLAVLAVTAKHAPEALTGSNPIVPMVQQHTSNHHSVVTASESRCGQCASSTKGVCESC